MMRPVLPFAFVLFALTTAAGQVFAQTAFDDPMASSGSSTGSLVAVEPDLDLGSLTLGSTSQAIVRFRNDATQAVTFGEINLYPSSNISTTVSLDQCKTAPLQFGGECAIVLSVKALKSGPFQAEILIQHSGRSKLITASVKGSVEASDKDTDQALGEIQAIPASLDFGDITNSSPSLRSVELRNITSDPLTIGSITFDSPQRTGFEVKGDCKELLPGQSCLVSLIWSPKQEGPASGFLVINHSGTSKVSSVEVKGNYKPAAVSDVTQYPQPIPGQGLLTADKTDIDFGDEVDAESAVTLTLVNAGDSDLTLKNMSLSVVTPGMTLDPLGCKVNQILKPTEACALTLRWTPQKIGKVQTDLRISHDGTRGVLVLPIKGKASAVAQGAAGFAAIPTAAIVNEQDDAAVSATGGISTDLPGSAGLSLDDVDELNSALTGEIADVISRTTKGEGPKDSEPKTVVKRDMKVENAAATLVNYIVTTHSINRAVILGPNGSKLVQHNKPVVIGGVRWIPAITPTGVSFTSGTGKTAKTVEVLFDSSIASNQGLLTDNDAIAGEEGSSDGSSSGNASPATSGAPPQGIPADGSSVSPNAAPGDSSSNTGNDNPSTGTGLKDIFSSDSTGTATTDAAVGNN